MKKLIWLSFSFLLLLSAFLIEKGSGLTSGYSDEIQLDSFRLVSKYVDENERCFKCHDKPELIYDSSLVISVDSIKLKDRQIITRQEFYSSSHKSLSCIGCHADPTPEAPDRTTREAAASMTCTDCHQYIKEHSLYQFASIEEEFMKSVHYKKKSEEFTCWKCHDPHKYRTTYRIAENIADAVNYANRICLSCHADAWPARESRNGQTDTTRGMHNWLPEIDEHFTGVRCMDCHTEINEDLLVAHLVIPEENSVKKCSECHFLNSILLTTVYKKQPRDSSATNLMFNSVVKKNIYVMGANRSEILNKICLSLLGLIICCILVHMIPRILTKKRG